MSSATWHIQLFGVVTASRGDRVINAFRTQQTARLLAWLAYRPNRVCRREELIEMIWPDADPVLARNRLNVALSSLRRDLGSEILMPTSGIGRNHIQLDERLFTTDSAQFESLLRSISPHSRPEIQIDQYEKALALYRGELLPGLDDQWTLGERQNVASRFLTGIRKLSKLLITEGRHDEALEHVRRALRYEPLCEDLHRLLIRLLCALGRSSEALGEHSGMVDRLKLEYGITLSDKTTETVHQLLFGDSETDNKRRVSEKPAAPKVRTQGAEIPHLNLDGGPLFGRDETVFEVSEQLRSRDVRLVSLTGMGGMGKTRLALAINATLADVFGNYRWFVPLADAVQPQHIEQAILRRMGLQSDARSNIHGQLTGALKHGPALLVLDNIEHMLPEAASIVRTLLDDLPELKCLVTSRQRLNLSLEHECPVAPLQTPALSGAPHRLAEFPSVQLFLHRASLVTRGFEINNGNAAHLAAICHHLEGLPLAIEMAAAWTRVLTPEEILARLTPRLPLLVSREVDVSDRHASVRRTLEQSYEQMPPHLKRLFARLSVFRGGWSAAAADSIGASTTTLVDIMDLRDRSLLSLSSGSDPVRNSYLELVREFAAERLEILGEFEDARTAHAHYFLVLAETAKPHLRGPNGGPWLDTLDVEQDNLRHALQWTLRDQPTPDGGAIAMDCGVRLASSLWHYWLHRGQLVEGIEWLRRAEIHSESTSDLVRATVQLGLGNLSTTAGDYKPAHAALNKALALYQQAGDFSGEADAYNGLGNLAFVNGDWSSARDHYEIALSLLVPLEDARGEAGVLANLANVAARTNNTDTAMLYFNRCLHILRSISDTHTLTSAMANSVGTLLIRNELHEAEKRLLECIDLSLSHGYPRVLAHCFEGIAEIKKRQVHPRDAVVMYAVAASIRTRINAPLPPSHLSAYSAEYDQLRTQLGEESFEAAWHLGTNLPDAAAAGMCAATVPELEEREAAR